VHIGLGSILLAPNHLSDGNLWWTGATNLGIRYALEHHADYVLTLNNDTLLYTDFIEKMLCWAEKKPNALLGTLTVDAVSGKVVYAGERVDWKTGRYQPLLDNLDDQELSGIHKVTHFPGRGLLIPAKVITKIGLFDQEHFPHYAADYDFTHRAIRGGFKVYCNYDARLKTYPEASGGQEIRKNRTLKNYWTHLFGVKGVGNLKIFWFYAIRNCPRKYLPFFLANGYARRIIGYWMHP
jgi:GT2 family glycosyltransferase